uniref:RecA family profile 1 domain-containing protein n=1 Tax=Aegilops tauschii subsp. strangulata TaxID=200361 RepID=A0A453SVX4_AEGTS
MPRRPPPLLRRATTGRTPRCPPPAPLPPSNDRAIRAPFRTAAPPLPVPFSASPARDGAARRRCSLVPSGLRRLVAAACTSDPERRRRETRKEEEEGWRTAVSRNCSSTPLAQESLACCTACLLLGSGQGGRAHMDMNEEQPHVEDRCVPWSDGMQLLKDAAEGKHFLPTGLEGIDTLLGGGLRKGQLTEITGQSSSGKTQVCLYSAAHVAARHMGAVLYLDTSNSFSPSRIAHILDELPISLIKEVSNKPGIHVPALLLPLSSLFRELSYLLSFLWCK